MKLAYVTAGAGGMYCGSCLNDNALARALIEIGHDVSLVPTYTPVRVEGVDVSVDRVFYGAIRVYLAQSLPAARWIPEYLMRWLDSPWLFDWISRRSSTIDARELGALTLSMLGGENGRQRRELRNLVEWLRREIRPDLVHLTNSMLLGLAGPLRRSLGVPIVCSVQGEDLFIDRLHEPWRGRVLEALREKATDVDAFVAHSRFYADRMRRLLGLGADRPIHVRPLGVRVEGLDRPRVAPPRTPYIVGYLARMAPEKGLDLLIEAFGELAAESPPGAIRLRIAGWSGTGEQSWVDSLRARVHERGLDLAVDWIGEVDQRSKQEFLRSIHVLSVPVRFDEPKGIYVLEALAVGVPVVVPRPGALSELIEQTGGGLLVEPDSAPALAAGLRELRDDPERAVELGAAGREVVLRTRTDRRMAERMAELYVELGRR